MKRYFGILGLGLLALAAGPAYADTCTAGGGIPFTETGVSPSDTSKQQDASACITINTVAKTITVVLTNDDTVITNVPNLLDGFSFVLKAPAPTTINFAATNPVVAANGFLDCTSGPCVTDPTFNSKGSPVSSPYDWGVVLGASGAPINTTFGLSDPALLAGGGSLLPAGIVNNKSGTTIGTHLTDAPHNDLLNGPVTFNLVYTGSNPMGVSAATFYWGTTGDAHSGGVGTLSVPEPASILLLGTVLTLVGRLLNKRLTA